MMLAGQVRLMLGIKKIREGEVKPRRKYEKMLNRSSLISISNLSSWEEGISAR